MIREIYTKIKPSKDTPGKFDTSKEIIDNYLFHKEYLIHHPDNLLRYLLALGKDDAQKTHQISEKRKVRSNKIAFIANHIFDLFEHIRL
jgi:hypothetical protein